MIRMTLLAVALASPSFGQTACGPRDEVIEQLSARYGETRRTMGVTEVNGVQGVVEMFGAEGGTWTLTFTDANRTTCLIASGDNFSTAPLPAGIEG